MSDWIEGLQCLLFNIPINFDTLVLIFITPTAIMALREMQKSQLSARSTFKNVNMNRLILFLELVQTVDHRLLLLLNLCRYRLINMNCVNLGGFRLFIHELILWILNNQSISFLWLSFFKLHKHQHLFLHELLVSQKIVQILVLLHDFDLEDF